MVVTGSQDAGSSAPGPLLLDFITCWYARLPCLWLQTGWKALFLLPGGTSSKRCGNRTLTLEGLGPKDCPIELRVCMSLLQLFLLVQ